MRYLILFLITATVFTTSCGKQNNNSNNEPTVSTQASPSPTPMSLLGIFDRNNQWGGQGISLKITATGSIFLDYDCAHGTVDKLDSVDSTGQRFTARGTHFLEHGGPVRPGEPQESFPVVYQGHFINSQTLVLIITRDPMDQMVGTYTLIRGEQPRIVKCL